LKRDHLVWENEINRKMAGVSTGTIIAVLPGRSLARKARNEE